MIVKFPQLLPGNADITLLASGSTPFAKHNVIHKTTGLQTGYLTEHTAFLVIKGKKNFHFSNGMVTVGSSELLLVKRGVYTISEQLSEDGTFEALMLFIPEKLIGMVAPPASPQGAATDFVVVPKSQLIQGFEQTYLKLFDHRSNIPDQLLPLKLQELFLLLSTTAHQTAISAFFYGCRNKEAFDIEFIVKEHLLCALSVPDYAKLCCRSVTSFKRDFEQLFGTSPKRWITKQRLEHARNLLKAGCHSVTQTADECGFESPSSFIKLYKKEYGKTPKKDRD